MKSPTLAQRGVALALLLWMLAAMTLLVSGLIALSRSDVQLTALQRDQARAQAAATGIAHVALRDLYALSQAGEYDASTSLSGQYELGGLALRVTISPASALVSINNAEAPLLEALLRHASGLSDADAAGLANAIIEWRSSAQSDGSGQSVFMDDGRGAFTVEEELLEVPGMNRDIYEALRPWIHTQTQATAELNLRAAPEFLLEAWRGVDAAAVDFALESRQDDAPNVAAPAGSTVPFALGGSVYCVDVDVTLADNRTFRQRIWVDMAIGAGGLPWRFTRVYPLTMRPANSQET